MQELVEHQKTNLKQEQNTSEHIQNHIQNPKQKPPPPPARPCDLSERRQDRGPRGVRIRGGLGAWGATMLRCG